MAGTITLRAPRNCSKSHGSLCTLSARCVSSQRNMCRVQGGVGGRTFLPPHGVDGVYPNRWTAWQAWRMAAPPVALGPRRGGLGFARRALATPPQGVPGGKASPLPGS